MQFTHLSREYLLSWFLTATVDLQWYQITLGQSQETVTNLNIAIESLHKQCAQSQGTLQHALVALEVEKQRCDTYRRVGQDHLGLSKRLESETKKRKELEALYLELLQGEVASDEAPTPTESGEGSGAAVLSES